MGKLRANLTYANVMSTLAVVLAIAGGTTAIAASVGKNSVTSKSIKPGHVTARDLAGVRVVTGGPGPGGTSRAACSGKEELIGGGAQGTQLNPPAAPENSLAVLSSYPEDNAWVVQQNRYGAGNYQAYALCLRATPGS